MPGDLLMLLPGLIVPADARVVAWEAMLRPDGMKVLARNGGIIAAGALASYGCGLMRHGSAARANTAAFTSLVGAQLLHALTCRSSRHSVFGAERLAANRPLTAALLGSAALQFGILSVPALRRFMGLARLDAVDVLISVAGAGLPYLMNEALKTRPRAPGAQAAPDGINR